MSETREKFLNAALDVFAEKGFEAATTRAIADRAGFREVTLFRHFGSKENLLQAILNEKSVMPAANTMLDIDTQSPPDQVLHEFGRRYFCQLMAREKLVRILVLESRNRPELLQQVNKVPDTIRIKLTGYLRTMMQQKKVRDGDPGIFAVAFLSLFFSLVMGKGFLTGATDKSQEQLADALVDVYLNGIMPRSSEKHTTMERGY